MTDSHTPETNQSYSAKLRDVKEALRDTSPNTSLKDLPVANPVEQGFSVRRDGMEYVDASSLNSEIQRRLGK